MPRSRGLVAAAVVIVTLAVGLAACGSDEPGATESTGGDAAQPADSEAAPAQPAPTKAPAG